MITSKKIAQEMSLKKLQHIQTELYFTDAKTVTILGK